MTIQIFPHSLKRLGFILFVIAFITNCIYNVSFFEIPLSGINPDEFSSLANNYNKSGFIGLLNAFTGGALANSFTILSLLHIVSMFGIIIYIMSKEKIEDDYISKLRLESFHLTAVITLILAILFYIVSINPFLTLSNIIFPFIWCYIIIFFLKKRLHI